MLGLPGQGPVYLIINALDECRNSGCTTAREEVLVIMQELIDLKLPHLHFLPITGLPEIDIPTILEPLTLPHMSLHDQSGQKQDILDVIKNVTHSDGRTRIQISEGKQMFIDTLPAKVDGM